VVTSTELQHHMTAPEQHRPASGQFEVLELLWQGRSALAKSAVLGFVIALGIAFLIPKQYESTTRLMPPDSQSLSGVGVPAAILGSLPSGAAEMATNLFGGKAAGATFVGVLQSRTVQDDLINRFDLRKVYGYKRYVDARRKLASRTSIAEDSKSGIITIAVTDNDPERARAIAASYVEYLNSLVSQLSTSTARAERVFLDGRLRSVKQDLDDSALRLSKFSSKNRTFDPQLQAKAMLEATAALQGQLVAAQTELSGLEQIYGPENSRVKASRARVGELQARLRGISGQSETATGSLGGSPTLGSSELYPSLEQLPLLGNTYVDLARRAKMDETIYEVLTKEFEFAKVQEAKEIPMVKVLDPADLPEKKSFPPRLIIGLLGGILAFLGVCAWFMLARWYSNLALDDPRKRFVIEFSRKLRSRLTAQPSQ
jgi:uncharacterized protein involved in exopolysaccharide biosynthesis